MVRLDDSLGLAGRDSGQGLKLCKSRTYVISELQRTVDSGLLFLEYDMLSRHSVL